MKFMEPKKIKVRARARQLFDPREMEELKSSFLSVGQLQPVLITKDNRLIAGERRVRACVDLGMQVWYEYLDETDDVKLLKAELDENMRRSAYTAVEEVLLKRKIFRIL